MLLPAAHSDPGMCCRLSVTSRVRHQFEGRHTQRPACGTPGYACPLRRLARLQKEPLVGPLLRTLLSAAPCEACGQRVPASFAALMLAAQASCAGACSKPTSLPPWLQTHACSVLQVRP